MIGYATAFLLGIASAMLAATATLAVKARHPGDYARWKAGR